VLQAYSGIDNVRLRDIVACPIRHLHAFVREAKPSDNEFEIGWTLMAEMAKFTGDERNEFLLFWDVTGVSQLIETIDHVRPQSAVGFALVGPFYWANAPMRKRGESIASDDTKGDRVHINGRVLYLTTNAPVAGATLDLCQAATNNQTTISAVDFRPTRLALALYCSRSCRLRARHAAQSARESPGCAGWR
jgi:catechol 1,2-dioxygenase